MFTLRVRLVGGVSLGTFLGVFVVNIENVLRGRRKETGKIGGGDRGRDEAGSKVIRFKEKGNE